MSGAQQVELKEYGNEPSGLVGKFNKSVFEDSGKGSSFFKPKEGVEYEIDPLSCEQVEASITDKVTQTVKTVPGLKLRINIVKPTEAVAKNIEFSPTGKRLCRMLLDYAERGSLFKWRFGLKMSVGSNGYNEYSLQALGERN